MDGAALALLIIGLVLLFLGTGICNCLVEKGAPDDAATAAPQDPHAGTKDGGLEVMGTAGEVVVEMAGAVNDAAGANNDSVTVGCCCGGGDGGGGGGCGGGCGGD